MPKISDSCLTEGTLLSDKAGPVDFHSAKAMVGWRWIRCGGMRWSWCRDAMRWLCRAAADDLLRNESFSLCLGSWVLLYTFLSGQMLLPVGLPVRQLLHSLVSRSARHVRREGGGTIRALCSGHHTGRCPNPCTYLAPGCRSLGRHFPRSSGKDR